MSNYPFKRIKRSNYYQVSDCVSDQDILNMANKLISQKFKKGKKLKSSQDTKELLTLKLSKYTNEVFGVIFLTAEHKIIADEILFHGTIDAAAVYPREVLKAALRLNAAAVILYHNHPSGHPEPSLADRQITKRLVQALDYIDIRVLDHIIAGGNETVSFAERGLL